MNFDEWGIFVIFLRASIICSASENGDAMTRESLLEGEFVQTLFCKFSILHVWSNKLHAAVPFVISLSHTLQNYLHHVLVRLLQGMPIGTGQT
jgi:hypothetical protein